VETQNVGTPRRVSVLGLGNMGSALAGALLVAGENVTVWNRTPPRMEPLQARGATCASSAIEAFQASPVVILCAGDHATGLGLLELVGEAVRGRTVVALSSGAPDDAKAMGAWLQANGARFVEGMIMVFPQAIGTDDARVLYAAPKGVFASIEPIIAAFGGSQIHVGEVPGSVSALGTAATGFFHLTLQAFVLMAESARRSGVEVQVVTAELVNLLGVLGEAMVASLPAVEGEVRSTDTATLELAAEEMSFVLGVLESLGLDLAGATSAKATIDRAVALGYGGGPLGSVVHAFRPAAARHAPPFVQSTNAR
jgi:3-hydroxyisobutyrate dehydrogenase-like beta-hydroxyacid dehydrogenase